MIKRVIGIGVSVAVLAVLLVVSSFFYYQRPFIQAETTVIIPPRAGSRMAISQLEKDGALPPLVTIAVPLFASGQLGKLKAGEYVFPIGLSPAEVISKLARGEVVIHKLTIPEGWNRYQLREALMKEPLLTGDLPPLLAEGMALPDTMHFTRGESREQLLARMTRAQAALLASLWETRAADLPITTPAEAVILASIVERETGVPEERAIIAGVFTNRLRIGMPLQSDPTVAYGIIVETGRAMERPLTLADLRRDTPYNSYTRTGLPPTPIANPGAASLAAVLNPARTDALYFVASGKGGHVFAATLEEHNHNVAAYRQMMRGGTPADPQTTPPPPQKKK